MTEVLMGFGHEPIWGVRGSPTDINYSMSKTFTPIPKWIDLDIEMIILVAWPHWHLAPTHISFMLSTRVNTEQARREATPFSFSLNYNVSFCRRNQSNPLMILLNWPWKPWIFPVKNLVSLCVGILLVFLPSIVYFHCKHHHNYLNHHH